MTINKKALILAFLSTLIVLEGEYFCAQTQPSCWHSLRQLVNTTIVKPDDGRSILNANLAYLENGKLIAFNKHSVDDGATKVSSDTFQWYCSKDGDNH